MKPIHALIASGLCLAAASAAHAQSASNFDAAGYFKGKTIRIQVGFGPGGGTDIQARHFAANWTRFMPGNPRFQVTNSTLAESTCVPIMRFSSILNSACGMVNWLMTLGLPVSSMVKPSGGLL